MSTTVHTVNIRLANGSIVGRRFRVEVNEIQAAQKLAQKAFDNASCKARECGGAIVVTCLEALNPSEATS